MKNNDFLIKGDMYQYNLGWLINELLSFKNDLATAIDLKTIKYADPIQWNITTQYPANTVVIDSNTGIAYMSKTAVPQGIILSNTDYWTVIFDYQEVYNKIMEGVAFNDGNNVNASKALLVNDLVWVGGTLYRVAIPISEGGQYVAGTNITPTSIESLLSTYYGRDRVAQVLNDTLNVSGDYTINAGDIAETSTNRTEKVTSDKTVDIDGNYTESVDGKMTVNANQMSIHSAEPLQFGTPEKYNDMYDCIKLISDTNTPYSVLVGTEKLKNGTTPYVTPEQYGATGDGIVDDTIALNAAIESGQVVIASKTYLVSQPLVLTTGKTFICSGSVINRSTNAFTVYGTDIALICKTIEGAKKGTYTAINITDPNTLPDGVTARCNVIVGVINGFENGIAMISTTSGKGVQFCNVEFDRIINCTNGIFLSATGSRTWVNQNSFRGDAIAGTNDKTIEVGLLSTSVEGSEITSNSFYGIGFEGCGTGVKMTRSHGNNFHDIRMAESLHGTYWVDMTDCVANTFQGYLNFNVKKIKSTFTAKEYASGVYNVNTFKMFLAVYKTDSWLGRPIVYVYENEIAVEHGNTKNLAIINNTASDVNLYNYTYGDEVMSDGMQVVMGGNHVLTLPALFGSVFNTILLNIVDANPVTIKTPDGTTLLTVTGYGTHILTYCANKLVSTKTE